MDNPSAIISPIAKKKQIRWRFGLAGFLAVGFVCYFFQPAFSAWWLARILTLKVREHSWILTSQKVEADFFSGRASFKEVRIQDQRDLANRLSFSQVNVDFSPWRLLFQPQKSPVNNVVLNTARFDWKWTEPKKNQPASGKQKSPSFFSGKSRSFFPVSLVGTDISARLECGNTKAIIESGDFDFQPNNSGEIHLSRFTASSALWTRSFTDLKGVTAIKERGLYVGGVRFADDLVLERGAVNFGQPDKMTVVSDFQFSVFGGQWRTDASFNLQKSPVQVEAAASFWNLSVNQVGDFLGNRDFAEGTLHEGRFTFRGNPVEPAGSNMSLRLNATDFRWQERRWNSLIFSALLVNRRVEIPQFELIQEKNQIKLNGHAELQGKWTRLPDEFQFQVVAQIDDLAAAGRILFANQKAVAGEAFFAGEVRNQNGMFSGNLKMRGGPLIISGVSVDRVRGDLDLHGSEINATALEFARRDDTAIGWATLGLAEPRRYSGEFEILARDVAEYSAILPKVVSDHAVGGGIKLWWSGDGTAQVHSGAFDGSLNNFLLSRESSAVPLDVTSHGSYSPAGITFNKLIVERPTVKLDTTMIVRPDSLELREFHVVGSGGSSINGNLTLPVNLFSTLRNPTWLALIQSDAAATGNLTGAKVRLEEVGELIGRRPVFRGRTTFDLKMEGTLKNLTSTLQISLDDFSAPQNLSISTLNANIALKENRLSLRTEINRDAPRDSLVVDIDCATVFTPESLATGSWIDSRADISGSLKATRFATSLLHPWFPFSRSFEGAAGASLLVQGTSAQPVWKGIINFQEIIWQPEWLEYPLQKLTGEVALDNGRISSSKIAGAYRGGSFVVSGSSGWSPAEDLDLTIGGKSMTLSTQADPSEAVVDSAVRLKGPASSRKLEGSVTFKRAILHRELTIVTPLVPLPVVSSFSLPWIPSDWTIDLFVKASQPLEIRGKDRSWLADPILDVSGPAQTPQLLGTLTLHPFASAENADSIGEDSVFHFWNTALENGFADDLVQFDSIPDNTVKTLDESSLLDQMNPPVLRRRVEISPLAP